jgi:hypothetical protein
MWIPYLQSSRRLPKWAFPPIKFRGHFQGVVSAKVDTWVSSGQSTHLLLSSLRLKSLAATSMWAWEALPRPGGLLNKGRRFDENRLLEVEHCSVFLFNAVTRKQGKVEH